MQEVYAHKPWTLSLYMLIDVEKFTYTVDFSWLTPERCSYNLELVIFKCMSKLENLNISYEITHRWMPRNLTDD